MKPYTYLVKCIPTNSYYYGVKYSTDADPDMFWKTYFTSSKYVHDLIEIHGKHNFTYEIRKVFSDKDSARRWETKVLKRMNAANRSDFINKTDNISIDSTSASRGMKGRFGKNHPAYGRKRIDLSERNSKQIGKLNPMFDKTGELAPNYGRIAEKHPMFGKTNLGASQKCKEIITCPHCNKTGGRSGMQRWHLDKCKFKENDI